ncbi:hypothetical protein NWP21_01295 [Anabaenopsis sp. FSS-46]|uniref:hypothetical protein n=1 Tax=Anabaenopsis sp. FSS-46 TaxID=2971766 RepID=UPI002474348C|nr:hypothetical protein [Anabaenopsis sp. FSS-46]MDH6097499.1 hypothetical protein [Anabaenopsis sp. FSS-46]
MSNSQNRLHDLEQRLYGRLDEKLSLQQGTQQQSQENSVIHRVTFDHNEPIILEYETPITGNTTTKFTPSVAPRVEVLPQEVKPEPPLLPMKAEVVTVESKPSSPQVPASPQSEVAIAKAETKESAIKPNSETKEFLADLQAIMNGEKTYDSNSKQVIDKSPTTAQAEQLSIPQSTPPVEAPKVASSAHDVFERMAQGIPPVSPAPVPTYSYGHSVFDRMEQSRALANAFEVEAVSLDEQFDEFDRLLNEENMQSQMLGRPAKNFKDELKSKSAELQVKSIVERYSRKLTDNKDKPQPNGRGWDGLKADYGGTTMEFIAQYRKDLVDEKLRKAIEETGQKGLVDFGDTGSSTPTSDYDVQLYDTGTLRGNPGVVIKKFYEDFRNEFGMESGTLFDTNIYDPSYRMPRPMVPEFELIAKVEEEVDNSEENKLIQDAGAFAKIRKFMAAEEWKNYKDELLNELKGYPETEKALTTAELFYAEYEKQLREQKEELSELSKQELSKELDADRELRAKNELYVFHLQVVQQRRKEQLEYLEKYSSANTEEEKNQAWKELVYATKELKKSMVIATLWAHEAYHSEGPMADVVGIEQGAFKKPLEKEKEIIPRKAQKFFYGDRINTGDPKYIKEDPKYIKANINREDLSKWLRLWSVNENFGDALKDIKHYGSSPTNAFETTAIQTSKYINRLLTIAETLFKDGLPEKYKNLKDVNEKLYDVRKEPIATALKKFDQENENPLTQLKKVLEINEDLKPDEKIQAYKQYLTQLNLYTNQEVRKNIN